MKYRKLRHAESHRAAHDQISQQHKMHARPYTEMQIAARASPCACTLKVASTMWCEFAPASWRTCSVMPLVLTRLWKKCSTSCVSYVPMRSVGMSRSKLRCGRPDRSCAWNAQLGAALPKQSSMQAPMTAASLTMRGCAPLHTSGETQRHIGYATWSQDVIISTPKNHILRMGAGERRGVQREMQVSRPVRVRTSTTCTSASSSGAVKSPKRWMPLRSPSACASALPSASAAAAVTTRSHQPGPAMHFSLHALHLCLPRLGEALLQHSSMCRESPAHSKML